MISLSLYGALDTHSCCPVVRVRKGIQKELAVASTKLEATNWRGFTDSGRFTQVSP